MPEERKEFQEMFSELNMYEKRGVYIAMEGKEYLKVKKRRHPSRNNGEQSSRAMRQPCG